MSHPVALGCLHAVCAVVGLIWGSPDLGPVLAAFNSGIAGAWFAAAYVDS